MSLSLGFWDSSPDQRLHHRASVSLPDPRPADHRHQHEPVLSRLLWRCVQHATDTRIAGSRADLIHATDTRIAESGADLIHATDTRIAGSGADLIHNITMCSLERFPTRAVVWRGWSDVRSAYCPVISIVSWLGVFVAMLLLDSTPLWPDWPSLYLVQSWPCDMNWRGTCLQCLFAMTGDIFLF
jgi:hypothetical protein